MEDSLEVYAYQETHMLCKLYLPSYATNYVKKENTMLKQTQVVHTSLPFWHGKINPAHI